ncbi:MAG: 1-deoxy-D-xylulose-5-phosphate reductoisomerase [Syntrophales bacterium]|jgi:1-deoxy-D-xylulose-5-phosphate reductoisomerase|nr:1-deoxy-D-xylulose-5-phosphate reductoisomerase [Syntrophales bacterium]MDY0043790.1 1-deoxy-D-xylulose-5-phosphate reductoisomerase [Syntrophales bacterium]
MKYLSLLGSTGSIGQNVLDVVSKHPHRFRIAGLTAYKNVSLLAKQITQFKPKIAAVADWEEGQKLFGMLDQSTGTKVVWGNEGYREVAVCKEASEVVSAMAGAAGLVPTLEAVEAGKDIALANKETMVMAGEIVMERARAKGVRILPIDSEHSAIYQCLEGKGARYRRKILLTASGGPFYGKTAEEIRTATLDEALQHPKWQMGKKITIDSATMMNKGLEIIEAMRFFDAGVDDIEVVVHPQSLVHSMVEFTDGSIIAQLGVTDMRVPISYALAYPERLCNNECRLDIFHTGGLDFFPPDDEKFPCLRIAREAARKGGTFPAVLNASNEAAVAAFIAGRIGFISISRVVEETIAIHEASQPHTIDDVLKADAWARAEADKVIERIKKY